MDRKAEERTMIHAGLFQGPEGSGHMGTRTRTVRSESRAGDVRGAIELHIRTRVLLPLSFEYAKYSSILSVSVNQSPSDSVRITKRGMKNRPDSTRVFERSDLSNSGYSLALVALTLPGHRVHVLATSFSLRPASMAYSSWL